MGELEDVTIGHGVSLLCWRVEASNTPTIRRLTPSRRHQLQAIARLPGAMDSSSAFLPRVRCNATQVTTTVCTENLNPDVVVMKSAKDRV